MYKPGGGGRSPPPMPPGDPPLKAELVTQEYSFSFIFDRFYSVFIFHPPPKLDFGGAPFPPEFAVFFGVYRCFYIFAPPEIGIHRIRHVTQNIVLLTVSMGFLYFPPPKLDPSGSKTCFYQGFQAFSRSLKDFLSQGLQAFRA